MALIEASLEELPVSAKLGQSCLATKISAPGPSSFGWFEIGIQFPVKDGTQSIRCFGDVCLTLSIRRELYGCQLVIGNVWERFRGCWHGRFNLYIVNFLQVR